MAQQEYNALCLKGDSYISEQNYTQAYIAYSKALSTINNPKKSASAAKLFLNLGVIHYEMNNDSIALECLTNAKHILKKNKQKESKEIAQVYEILGDVYVRRKDYVKASKKYRKAMHIRLKQRSSSDEEEEKGVLASIAHKRGTAHIRRGNRSKARKRFKQAKDLQPDDEGGAEGDENEEENDSKIKGQSEFLSANLTDLKTAIHSSDNDYFNSFCDIKLFYTFNSILDQLKSTLQTEDDLTRDKCTTLKRVCKQHLDLQILIIEANAGIKARLYYESAVTNKRNVVTKEEIHDFLSPFVKDVTDFNHFLKETIENKIHSMADLVLEDSLAMKALIQIVQDYEEAGDKYKEEEEEEKVLEITSIKDAVITQCRKDFELKSFEVFSTVHMTAADNADEDNVLNSQLTATIQAATKLVGKIEPVQNLFPSSNHCWTSVKIHWSLCVSDVCSNNLLQQVGGPTGTNLSLLSTTQLKDLVTWVEFFCDTLERAHPSIAGKKTEKDNMSMESRPELLHGNGEEVEEEKAMEGLAWAKNMLWEVHYLAQEMYEARCTTETELENNNKEVEESFEVNPSVLAVVKEETDETDEAVVSPKNDFIGTTKSLDNLDNDNGKEEEESEESEDSDNNSQITTESTTQSKFLKTNLKKLRTAIQSPTKPFHHFCNLALFTNIPPTLERIRKDIETKDLMKDKCSVIRSACREHLDLQILLVEADSGMKGQIESNQEVVVKPNEKNGSDHDADDEAFNPFALDDDALNPFAEETTTKTETVTTTTTTTTTKDVDEFLAPFIKDVWDLGEFINETILSRVGSFANLALGDPPAMKTLIDTVEEYNVAVEYYQETRGEEGKLKIKSIKEAVILQCRKDFESKSFEVFSTIHMYAADNADEDDSIGSQLTSTIHAATKLVGEIEPVKQCFPHDWFVDIHWSLCVSNVCANNLLQQIGGPEGGSLSELSTNQLRDLVTWVEFFCDTLERTYPRLSGRKQEKMSMESRPELLHGDGRKVKFREAMDGLAWERNMLWRVHYLAKEMCETRSQADAPKDVLPKTASASASAAAAAAAAGGGPTTTAAEGSASTTSVVAGSAASTTVVAAAALAANKEESPKKEPVESPKANQRVEEIKKENHAYKQADESIEQKEMQTASQSQFLKSNLKKLRTAINAPNDAFNSFCNLELFSNIPPARERLKNILQTEDLTRDKCRVVQSTCREHLDLQILLVEANSGMKARLEKGKTLNGNQTNPFASTATAEDVDEFLAPFIKDVWELGDFIELTLLSRIGSFATLSLENPPAMKTLIDTVEEYEAAIKHYHDGTKKVDEESSSLQITSIKEAVIKQCRRDFETKSFDVFSKIHMYAADNADEDDAVGSQLSATIQAATNLVGEIDPVKKCFPEDWGVDVHWSLCVSNVCSNYLLQKIGGPDGHNLPDLSLTQLLDLITWVEFFCNTFESNFPSIAEKKPGKMSMESRPELLNGDGREINTEDAMDGLAWAKNMLWEIHRLAKEEFLVKTRSQTDTWLDNIYGNSERTRSETTDGKLITSLCEEVFSFIKVHLRTIRDHLPPKSDIFPVAVCIVLSRMQAKQIDHRDSILTDLETCCAAANDFSRMSERIEEMMSVLKEETDLAEDSESMLDEACLELVSLYSSHAVYAAQYLHVYVFEPIHESISDELFSLEWEDNLTHNQLSVMVTKTIEDFRCDLEVYLSDFLLKKVLDALVTASVIFYIQCLLKKSERHTSKNQSCFQDNAKALGRMMDDIQVMRKYFEGHVAIMPALKRTIQKEFEVITIVRECISVASAATSDSINEATNFVYVLHKRFSNVDLTKQFIGDLWHLVTPSQEREVRQLVESMETELKALAPPGSEMKGQSVVPGLRLDEMVLKLYSTSKRRRPGNLIGKMTNNRRFKSETSGSISPKRMSFGRQSRRPKASEVNAFAE